MSLIGTMGSGVSALQTFTKGLEVIGNNIANVNTTAFKASTAKYADSFSTMLQSSATSATGASNTPAKMIGSGVMLQGITTNFTQGSIAGTGRSTDLSVSGNGYFRVKNSVDDTEFVTRAGDFRWDDQGYLVTAQGYRVQGLAGAGLGAVGDIQLGTPPANTQVQAIAIDKSGNVTETYSDGSLATTGKVLLQSFRDPAALMSMGHNLYSGMTSAGAIGSSGSNSALQTGTTNAPGLNGLGTIQAGALELSNVDLADQFANLITTQRSFQAGSRLITVSDSLLEDIVNLKR